VAAHWPQIRNQPLFKFYYHHYSVLEAIVLTV
jgi:hypothetical protein